MPQRIILLDDSLANMIAAGEVVERPASVAKELVENAIDAGATRVEVDLLEGGKKLVRVRDDGCGMGQEDAVLSLQRHATSKIRDPGDLAAITTLGFRGEALPSIASVSRFRLTTREPDSDEGVTLTAEGGEITDVSACGCPPGTTIEVHHLFYNTPARLKFLKTSATERGHVSDLVAKAALAWPDIAFRLTHNSAQTMATSGAGDVLGVLGVVHGPNTVREFMPIEHEEFGARITGFVSSPNLTRVNRSYEFFFVNRRPVRSRILSHAMTEAYHGILPPGKFALCAIHLDLDPRLVDPNVHPTKVEVRFTDGWMMHNAVRTAVREALAAKDLVPGVPMAPGAPAQDQASRPSIHRTDSEVGFDLFRQELRRKAGITPTEPAAPPPIPAGAPLADARGLAQTQLRPVAQVHRSYIVAEADGQVLIIDQHKAAERVIADRLQKAEAQKQPASQLLMIPVTLELTHREASALAENLEALEALGFVVEPFGQNTCLLRGIPLVLVDRNYEVAARELIAELAEGRAPESLQARQERVQATVACKAAIKAGESMTPAEMEQLLSDLQQTERPDRCPHGSPIAVTIPLAAVHAKFGRH